MFGWLKKRKPAAPELVFGSRKALLAHLEKALSRAEATTVVVCAFELSLSTLEAELAGRTCSRVTTGTSLLNALRDPPPDKLLTATTSVVEDALATAAPGSRAVHLLVLERHPLRVHDDGVEALAAKLGGGSRVTFLLSLDDPFFERFGGNLKGLMEKLGIGDEPLEHPLISKSIASAQAKLAEAVPRETYARSAEDWYRANQAKR